MKYQKNSLKKMVVLGAIFMLSVFAFSVEAQTWANPACAPTGCNTPTPINVSGSSQGKTGAVAVGRSTVPASTEFTLAGLNFDTTLGNVLKFFVSGQSLFSSDNFTQLFVRGTRADRAGGVNISNSADARIRLEIAGPSSQLTNLAPGNALISATNNLQFQGNSGSGRLAQIFLQGATGNVGINTNAPTAKLDVNGSVRIRGGAPALNKILASDANGLSSWKTKEELGIVAGSDTSKWSTSGLHILNKNTGGVGIGTGGIDYLQYAKLFVGGSSVTTGSSIVQGNLATYGTLTVPNNTLSAAASTGRVGIGTNIPTTKLDVDGTLRFRSGAPALNKILAAIDSTGVATWKTATELGIGGSNWTLNGINLSNKNIGGNVGIGSVSPTSLLTVQGNSNQASEIKIIGTNDTINNNVGLNVDSARNAQVILDRGNTGQTSYIRHATGGTADWYTGINARQNSDYQITRTFNSLLSDLVIDKDNGNVGINITGPDAPTTKLDINGTLRLRGGAPGLNKILASDANGLSSWKTATELGIGGSNWTISGNNISNKNTGNVGIGVVPSYKLQVKGSSLFEGIVGVLGDVSISGQLNSGDANIGGNLNVLRNTNVDGTINIRKGATTAQAPATNKILSAVDATGLATWKSATELGIGGSNWTISGNNISNKNTGNVGVGTNNPNPAAKLHVEGNLKVSNFITAPYINAEAGGFMITPKITITGGEPAPGKVLTATDASGNANWGTPLSPRISTATFLKSDGVNSNFVLATIYDSKFSNTNGRQPQYSVEENEVYPFFPPSWSNIDYGIMTCPVDTIVISGGVTCDSDRAVKVNTIRPYYGGGIPNKWMVSCGNELSFIQSMHVTCMAVN